MYFYFLMIPITVMSLYVMYRLREMAKHDRVLFKLCDNRREMMAFLRESGTSLSKEDYFALRELIEVTNQTIHNYSDFKNANIGFNVGKRIEYGRSVKHLDTQIQERQGGRISNPQIAGMYNNFAHVILIAVLTFIPLPELAIKVTPLLFRFLTIIGVDYFNSNARRAVDFFSWLKQRRSQEPAYR